MKTQSINLLSNRPASSTLPAVSEANELSFNDVYKEYRDTIYSFVYFRLDKDPDQTEDVVSEVFVKVYKALPSYDSKYAVSTWLYTIAKNTLIDHYRRRKETVDVEFEMMTDQSDPMYLLMSESISLTEVEEAIESLPEMQKVCIKEQFWGTKNAKELGEELGISHASVRKHVSRGVAALRGALLTVTLLLSEIGNLLI